MNKSNSVTKYKKKIFKTFAKFFPGNNLRIQFLKKCNYRIGRDVYIGEDLIVIDVLNDSRPFLFIGDRVSISPRVTLVIHAEPNLSKIADFVNSGIGPIVIENDVWIGTGAVILPNVTIGEGAVVGANAVVTKNIPPYTVAGGIPAKKIKNVTVPWFDDKGD